MKVMCYVGSENWDKIYNSLRPVDQDEVLELLDRNDWDALNDVYGINPESFGKLKC